jgi:hypothetical protein
MENSDDKKPKSQSKSKSKESEKRPLAKEDLLLTTAQLTAVNTLVSNIVVRLNSVRVEGNEEFCSDAIENALTAANALADAGEPIRTAASIKKRELLVHVDAAMERAKKLEAIASRGNAPRDQQKLKAEPVAPVGQSKSTSLAGPDQHRPSVEELSWSTVAGKNRPGALIGHTGNPSKTKSVPAPPRMGSFVVQAQRTDLAPTSNRELAPDVNVPSMDIDRAEQCHDHLGKLCYLNSQKKFVFSLNGLIVPIYATRIIEPGEPPVKTEEFDAARGCSPQNVDKFYHPPEHTGKTDHRNFLKSLTYCSGADTPSDRFPVLRLGDRDNLSADMASISDEDARMFVDWTANTLAATLALMQSKKI